LLRRKWHPDGNEFVVDLVEHLESYDPPPFR